MTIELKKINTNNLEELDLNLNSECVTNFPKIEESAMAIVIYKNKILATNELIYGNEKISLPKGHKEENETILETAIRECFEETNIVLKDSNLVKKLEPFSYDFSTPNNDLIRKMIYPFLFRVDEGGIPLPKEERILWVRWIEIAEFINICTYENIKVIVENIFKKGE